MLHDASVQLQATSGHPLANACDALDDEAALAFRR